MDNLPWIVKYRPTKLDDVLSQENIVNVLKVFIENDNFPHLLFYGPSGTGKTSVINACVKELYGDNSMIAVMELNASNERGIEIVRNRINPFVSSYTHEVKFKMIILDEADAMTLDAQSVLRNMMEKYAGTAKFCFICNYIEKISPAIQSRCSSFRFVPLSSQQMKLKIKEISKKENFIITDSGIDTTIRRSGGDMRKVLNTLQSISSIYKTIDSDIIDNTSGYPTKDVFDSILTSLIKDDFKTSLEKIKSIKYSEGLSVVDITKEIYSYLIETYIKTHKFYHYTNEQICSIFINLKKLENNTHTISSDDIQLTAFIGIFKM